MCSLILVFYVQKGPRHELIENDAESVGKLVEMPHLAEALEGERFRQFLDHIPFGVAVSNLEGEELIIYANPGFERLTGLPAAKLEGKRWDFINSEIASLSDGGALSTAITDDEEYVGRFNAQPASGGVKFDTWSNRISDDSGKPIYRLVALAETAFTAKFVARERNKGVHACVPRYMFRKIAPR